MTYQAQTQARQTANKARKAVKHAKNMVEKKMNVARGTARIQKREGIQRVVAA